MTGQEIRRTLQREFVRTLRKPFVDAVKQYRLVQRGIRSRFVFRAARIPCCWRF